MDNNQDIQRNDGLDSANEVSENPAETDVSMQEGNAEDMPEGTSSQKPPSLRSLKIASALYDYVEIFAISIIAVIFIFSFCIRLCRVDGSSMNNTLFHNEQIIATDTFYVPKQGDIIVFHLSNESYHEPLVKRVIAVEGQTVEINMTDCTITVDGVEYADEHAYISGGKYKIRLEFNKEYMSTEGGKVYFRATVPEGKVFVLGDNRNGSSDSRSERIGFVDVDCILGKAVLRLKPFTLLSE